MQNMKYNLFIVLCFLIIIFGVLFWYPIKHFLVVTGISELQTTDNWIFFERTKEGIVGKISDSLIEKKTMIENRTTNYFPFYHTLNTFVYNFNYNLNSLIYSNDIPIGLNSDNEYIFLNTNSDYYYLRSRLNLDELDNRLDSQINFFNELSESNENVSLNIYIPTSYELTTLSSNNLNSYISTFVNRLNKGINTSVMKINSNKGYKDYFYSTDHHWNINGALSGYKDIMTMLNKNYRTDLNVVTIDNLKYHGSIAKSSLSTRVSDNFYDIDLNLDYKVLVNGKENSSHKPRKMTYSGNNAFFDYYVHYFNGQYGMVEYDYDNKEDNLLIFNDSYGWEIDYLIASHYNKTYVVNLRYDDYKMGGFNYNEFINNNNIKDVLFLYQGESTLFDQYDYGMNSKISR